MVSFEPLDNMHHCSIVATRSLVGKNEDPRELTIPFTIGSFNFTQALFELGDSINLMLLVVYKQLVFWAPKQTSIRLLMVDRTVN